MKTSNQPAQGKQPARPHRRRIIAWLKLVASIAVLAIWVFGLAPMGLKLPGMAKISRFAEANDIKVTAFYYTDVEEFAQAEANLRSRLEYGHPYNR